MTSSEPNVRYAAKLDHVREVALTGCAELSDWAAILRWEGLAPRIHDDKARVLLTSVEGRFAGLVFRELSLSVHVAWQHQGRDYEGYFLAHAFNSNRFFAWVERNWFSTPYYAGDLQVETGPVRFALRRRKASALEARMDPVPRPPDRTGPGGWSGPIVLPARQVRGKPAQAKCFYAKIEGETSTWAFDPARDQLVLDTEPGADEISQLLAETGFEPQEWSVRQDARHAKSKTFLRREWPGLAGF